MALSRGSLRTFLENAKSSLQNAIINQQRVTLVIGNESADLDSITSAIVLSYLRSNALPSTPLADRSVNKHTIPSQFPPLYIPVLNIPRADVKIRPELLKLLPYANLEPSHLITLDDLNATPPAGLDPSGRESLQPQRTTLILTDHNKLAGPLADQGFSDQVRGCIDHHVEENAVPRDTGDEPRIIETAGSCTSLVMQYCRDAWNSLSVSASTSQPSSGQNDDASVNTADDVAVRRLWDAQVAKLAIASILIDTSSLRDKSKTTDTDRQVVDYLEAKITLATSGTVLSGADGGGDNVNDSNHWDRDAFYKEINTAKKTLDDLTLEEILRKDYKQWDINGVRLGISSVVKPLTWQIKHQNPADTKDKDSGDTSSFLTSLTSFSHQRNLSLCAVMTTSTSKENNFQRELLLYSLDPRYDSIVDKFEKQAGKELGLDPWSEVEEGIGTEEESNKEGSSGRLKIWWQRETKNSRKQVAPFLRRACEGQ